MLNTRTGRFGIALAAAAGLFAAIAAPALAVDPNANSSAFGLRTIPHKPILGLIAIQPQAQITFPPGGTNNALAVNLGALGGVGVIDTSATGNQAAGTSAATSHIADVALLSALNAAFPGISASAVDASCNDAAPAAPTGSTSLANAHLGANQVIDLSPAPNDVLLNLPGLVKLTLNEQTLSGGVLTVNAIHLQLGTNGSLGDLVIAHVTCGPNAPQTPAFNFGETPIILGGIAVLLALVFGIRAGLRRTRAQA